ncbi:hypothetical protein JOF56_005711 [Kibdelosporangium banguiense]|uniref:ATP-binding protein n=1 Tax=Kibdelosporangium banguiense TaxID=1365924 RepID=A0ABS4TLR7_9PSEU|nr:hypothetical protein [Kibdelosporangium banguiense]MBP2325326.1 hypothetical protein [Kibdelosporangium banguiense]
MLPTVRRVSDYEWIFGEARRWYDGAGSIVIKRNDLAAVTATDLARALRKEREDEVEPEPVLIDHAPDDQYEPKESIVEPISFVLTDDGHLAVNISFEGNEYLDNDDQLQAVVTPLIKPLLQRNRADLISLSVDGYRSSAPYFHTAVLGIPTRGKTLQHLYDTAESVVTLLEAATSGEVTRQTVIDLILGGRADLLIGQREGPWLDVKAQHYDFSNGGGQISLTQAISRFGNAEEGGAVVVGMETKKVPGGESIKSLKPVPLDGNILRRYRQVLENRLFPFPTGLKIDAVSTSPGSGLVVVSIPPQDEELKPFLVHGAIVDGRVEGAFISIVRRSGEDSIPITAQQIHSTLAAGRALLRRGQLPKI